MYPHIMTNYYSTQGMVSAWHVLPLAISIISKLILGLLRMSHPNGRMT